MPSSTFNSESKHASASPRLQRAALALLVCALLVFVAVEGAARFGLQRVSRIHRRILQEAAEARNITQPADGARSRVLFVGNSLLLEGMDMDRLKAGLDARYEPQRYVVESTYYLDWLYGLRKLFREGMRPAEVVLSLNAAQLTARTMRGDFSSYMMFDAQDIWPAARDSGADLTTTSGLFMAHYSEFYAARAELRTVLMFRFAPPVVALWHDAVEKPGVFPPDDLMIPVMMERYRKLNELCGRYGSKFVFLVPPTRQAGDTAMLRAGEQSGIQVLRPIPNYSLSADYYRDGGLHLNAKGAALFTAAIVDELR